MRVREWGGVREWGEGMGRRGVKVREWGGGV